MKESEKYNLSILFVEDNISMRKNYLTVFSNRFETVYEAGDGIEALNIYKDKKPDIMLIDIDLPKLNGLELLEKIRENDFNTKAILLTSFSDSDTLLKASSLKLTQYLVKPVNRKDLFAAFEKAIREIKQFNIQSNEVFELKDFSWSFIKKELLIKEEIIKLTKTEKEILNLIFINAKKQKATSYDELLYSIWDEYSDSTLKSLKTIMTNIRKKISNNIILNEYGIGYKVVI